MFARAKVGSFPLGHFPTPVERLETLSTPHCDLWVKRDDLTHAIYGGNKVRKLERVLASATAAGVTRIVTVGAAGSHHVLATTYFGSRVGIAVEAVLVPQPRTSHVVDVLRADIALGLRAFAARSWARAPFAVARRVAAGARFVTVGGSSLDGAMGYVDAAYELGGQVRSGAMPEPDLCVVALGSGGTAAGLAAGFLAQGMKTRVVAVCVSQPIALLRMMAYGLAWGCARRAGVRAKLGALRYRIAINPHFLGRGYGYATPQGEAATRDAAFACLALDQTYTAKAFACALATVRSEPPRARCVLYWHTLSSAPLQPLLVGAPSERELESRAPRTPEVAPGRESSSARRCALVRFGLLPRSRVRCVGPWTIRSDADSRRRAQMALAPRKERVSRARLGKFAILPRRGPSRPLESGQPSFGSRAKRFGSPKPHAPAKALAPGA